MSVSDRAKATFFRSLVLRLGAYCGYCCCWLPLRPSFIEEGLLPVATLLFCWLAVPPVVLFVVAELLLPERLRYCCRLKMLLGSQLPCIGEESWLMACALWPPRELRRVTREVLLGHRPYGDGET